MTNRHTRRAMAAQSDSPLMRKYDGPTPKIRLLLIDPWKRQIVQVITPVSPENIRKVLRKDRVEWAKLGTIEDRIDIMLAGDASPQVEGAVQEPEFVVMDDAGMIGPDLHGRAIVFGFAPALKMPASTPVNPIWLQDRVMWRAWEGKPSTMLPPPPTPGFLLPDG